MIGTGQKIVSHPRPNLNIIIFYQKRYQRVAVTAATSLHTANFIKKRRQDPLIGVAYTRKLVSIGVLDRATDQRLAVLERPFMNSMPGIMDIAVKKCAMLSVIQYLTD